MLPFMAAEFDPGRLREEIAKRGWTQLKLAEESGLGQGNISHLLAGDHPNPTRETLERLADTLEVSQQSLLRSAKKKGSPSPAKATKEWQDMEPLLYDLRDYVSLHIPTRTKITVVHEIPATLPASLHKNYRDRIKGMIKPRFKVTLQGTTVTISST
jgi:transcriptional regulator with XRE-family HTH domain